MDLYNVNFTMERDGSLAMLIFITGIVDLL